MYYFYLENCQFTEIETQSLIKKKLENIDTDIQSEDSLKICTICPLSRKIVDKPVRGINCLHLECFDLDTYVKLGFQTFKWTCPICSKFASQTELKLDNFILKILKSQIDKNSNDDMIEIFKDFKWRSFSSKLIKSSNIHETTICDLTNDINETIVLSDGDEDDDLSVNDQENTSIECEDDDDTDLESDSDERFSNEMTVLEKSLCYAITQRVLRPRQSVNETSIQMDKQNKNLNIESTHIEESTIELQTASIDDIDSTCLTCKRKFKGIRGLKSHLGSRTTTCTNTFK